MNALRFFCGILLTSVAFAEPEGMHEWEADLHKVVKWEPLKIVWAGTNYGGLELLGNGWLKSRGAVSASEKFTIRATTELRGVTAFRVEVLPGERSGGAVLSEFQVLVALKPLKFATASADYGQPKFALDGNAKTGWRFDSNEHAAVFTLAQPASGEFLFVLNNENMKRVRITATTAAPPLRELPQSIRNTIVMEPSERSPEQRKELERYFLSTKKR